MRPTEDESDFQALIEQLYVGHVPDRSAALPGGYPLEGFWRRPEPALLPVPETTLVFRIRVDLLRTKPPVWRRIEVPGDLTLDRLHEVLQAVMGWTDSHLHRFRMGNIRNAAEFLTRFDVAEGDEGMLEDEVRLDQIVSAEGDRLWYDYDFGDGWEHVLRVEKVLDTPLKPPSCVGGKLACPPEDCGGTWGYSELAEWVRSDYDDALRPEVFDTAEEALGWLPDSWHPDVFDLDETNALLAAVSGDPGPVGEELESLLELSRYRGFRGLREVLARPASHGPTEISAEDAARLTQPFRVLLEVVAAGAHLTSAGYLNPAAVEQIARCADITEWWVGKANREDLTWPVADLRAAAQSLGLASVRAGRIAPTQAAKRCVADPEAVLRHVISRLPIGKTPADRHAGWVTLAVVGSETPAELWEMSIASLMFELGWRDSRNDNALPPAHNPTLDVLSFLAGAARTGRRLHGIDPAVAAAARTGIRLGVR